MAPCGSVVVVVQVTNASSHHPINALPVDFVMSGAFPVVHRHPRLRRQRNDRLRGATNVSMTIPSRYLGSTVSISATVDSGGYLGGNSVSIGINLLGLAGLIALSETFPYNVLLFTVIMAAAIGIGLWFGRHRTRGGPGALSTGRPATPATGPRASTSPSTAAPAPSPCTLLPQPAAHPP